MRLTSLVLLLITSFGVVVAQSDVSDLRSNKKALKKNLISYAPYVFDVKFDGCDVKIKISSRSGSDFSFSPSSFVGGGFPRDDGSGAFSTGPGNAEGRKVSSSRSVLRLSDLNVDDVTVIPPYRGKMSTVRIVDNDRGGAIGNLRKGVVSANSEFKLMVDQKKAAKVADSVRTVIAQCKDPN